jgi:hypothetical protein
LRIHPACVATREQPFEADAEQSILVSPTAVPHPEEMKGTVTFSLGDWAS